MNRLEILKTYKIYIGGQFPRTESGRSYQPVNSKGKPLANMCLSSRKDVRNAVSAARKAFGSWSERSAFNRGQIIYRIAEMLETRKAQFVEELIAQGSVNSAAEKEVHLAIDRLVYYAGWCDKYQHVVSSVNPVASSHFNFSVAEPMGVIGIHAPQDSSLIGLVSLVIPALVGGNTVVAIAPEQLPLCAITFAEVLNSSDVPSGVVNIVTGKQDELKGTLVAHMDVNAIVYGGSDKGIITAIEKEAIINLKRTFHYDYNWMSANGQDLHFVTDLQEIKTTWHPIEHIGGATSSY